MSEIFDEWEKGLSGGAIEKAELYIEVCKRASDARWKLEIVKSSLDFVVNSFHEEMADLHRNQVKIKKCQSELSNSAEAASSGIHPSPKAHDRVGGKSEKRGKVEKPVSTQEPRTSQVETKTPNEWRRGKMKDRELRSISRMSKVPLMTKAIVRES